MTQMVLDYKVKSHLEQTFVEDGDFMTYLMELGTSITQHRIREKQ